MRWAREITWLMTSIIWSDLIKVIVLTLRKHLNLIHSWFLSFGQILVWYLLISKFSIIKVFRCNYKKCNGHKRQVNVTETYQCRLYEVNCLLAKFLETFYCLNLPQNDCLYWIYHVETSAQCCIGDKTREYLILSIFIFIIPRNIWKCIGGRC